MAYIGNDLQVAFSTYKNIDDISGSFNGVTTSFALLVNGVAPAPLPLNSNQCLISVGGVVQRPDDTGIEGFRLSGGNIVFSSAPNTAEDFFGVILAGADYVNAGVNFPDGTLAAPSITFDQDNDTGYYRSGSGSVSFASNGVAAGTWSSAGLTAPAFIPTGSSVPANGVYLPGTNRVGLSTNSTARLEVDASGRLLVGTSTAPSVGDPAAAKLTVTGGGTGAAYLNITRSLTSTSIANNSPIGSIFFTEGSGGIYAQIQAFCDGTSSSTSDLPGRLAFSVTQDGASSPTERMRVEQDGRINMFAASGSSLEVANSNAAGTTNYIMIGRHSSVSINGGTTAYVVYTNGNVQNTNGSYTTLSDAKLKENIVDAGSQWDDLKAIQIRNWNFKAETGHETHRQIGPIAQELETVCPGLVFETPDRDEDGNETGEVTKGVNQSVLYMKAVKALQEAMERIEQLEQRLTDAGIA